MGNKLKSPPSLNSKQVATTPISSHDTGENEQTTLKKQQQTIDSVLQKEQVLKAEIMLPIEDLT